ncbi:thiamine phosphate synthase [Paenibacillus tengchongensis]|uniref:thiamine phosphate synthase n=1 Tax=Paenibacillus tengchongensis TaxID=2608684 RepID=UPI00124F6960|nr:thiamine phosphate synthase [Paenibacillus tengchongensis]
MSRIDPAAMRSLLRLYFIMGSVNCPRLSPADTLREAIAGGVTLFQYREKGAGALQGAAALELGRQLQAICRENSVPFIVNDDIGLAELLDADGVHVGQDDAPARELRRRLGAHKIIGVSAHTVDEARQAVADGADYLGIGPIYPTASKDDARAVQGPPILEELRRCGLDIPLVGIGGITAGSARPVIEAGADGVSVISAIAAAEDIRQASAGFRHAMRQ